MATPGHRHTGSTSSLSGRRSAIVADALTLKLPRAMPKLVLPPTPTSPEGGNNDDEDYATLSWRPRTPTTPAGSLNQRELPPTPPSSDNCSLPPSSPPSLVFEELPPPPVVPAKPKFNAVDNSYNGILKRGYQLHSEFVNNYDVLEELGSGGTLRGTSSCEPSLSIMGTLGYGVVVRAVRKADQQELAVKLMWSHKIPADNWVCVTGWDTRLPAQVCNVPKEAWILRNIHCEGVVRFVDLFSDDIFVYLVMAYFGSPWNAAAPVPIQSAKLLRTAAAIKQIHKVVRPPVPARKGSLPLIQPPARPEFVRRSSCDLFECLEQHDFMPEALAKGIFRQIVDSVAYLHTAGVVHCDLKDENIVINADYRVKLIDFGSAIMLDRGVPAPFQTNFRGVSRAV